MAGVNEDRLIEAARAARHQAYAPYSGFAVGAAVLTGSGEIYPGVNVENASYGLTVCAERAAIFAAVTAGERTVEAVAVVTEAADITPPCGACRQVIAEFGATAVVVCEASGAIRHRWSIAELLPHPFGPANLSAQAIDGDSGP
jgi:cytidine deaminase